MDFIQLTPDYYILEIAPLDGWIDKTIAEVGVRDKYGINILATKKDNKVHPLPGAKHIFKMDELLIVAANKDDIFSLIKKR